MSLGYVAPWAVANPSLASPVAASYVFRVPTPGAPTSGASGAAGAAASADEAASVATNASKTTTAAEVSTTISTTETTAASSTKNAPGFIVDSKGTAYPVPKGSTGPNPTPTGKGIEFTGGSGGANGQVSTMRIMNPIPAKGNAPAYPNGYIKYENATGQGVNPYTGKTGARAATHYPINGCMFF